MKRKSKTEKHLIDESEAITKQIAEAESIIKAIGDGISIQDTHYKILYQNQVHKRYFGDHIGEYCHKVYPQKDSPCKACPLTKTFKDGSIHTTQRKITLGGRQLYFEITSSPLKNAKGTIIAGIEVVRDITNSKQVERDLKRSENILSSSFVALDGLLVVIDRDYRVILSNWKDHDFVPEEKRQGHPYCFEIFKNRKTPCVYCPPRDTFVDSKFRVYEDRNPVDSSYKEISVSPVFDDTGNVVFVVEHVRDITDRKRSEEAKREREEKLQSIFRVAPTGIGLVRNRILLDVNPRICEMTGYVKEELLGKSARIFYPTQEDFEYVGTEKYRQIAERGTGVVETKWMKKDGTILDVILASTPLDLNDLSKGVTFTALDITKRKRAEQAQRLNESRISALLELSRMTNQPDQMLTDFALEKAIELTHSTIGYLAFMNEDETILTMYSWSRQAMQECMIEKKPIVYPVETTGLWGEPVRQRKPLITNDYQAPNPLRKGYPEGHVHVKRHMNIPLFDGDRIVLVAGVGNKEYPYEESDIRQLTLLMDGMWKIIKQKRVDEALRDSEEKYHSAIDNAGDMILLADLDGNLLEVNKKAQELLGYTKKELTAMHYSMIHPTEELERISDAFAEIILKGRTYFKDSIILRKDGTTIPVDITGSLITYAGKLLVQGIFSDRTERKKAEDELKKNEKELQKRVEELEEFYDMAVGRELRMVELKNEIERLKKDLEKKKNQ